MWHWKQNGPGPDLSPEEVVALLKAVLWLYAIVVIVTGGLMALVAGILDLMR